MALTPIFVFVLLALSGLNCLQQSSDSQDTLTVGKIEARLAALESQNDAFGTHVSRLEEKNDALEDKVNVLENKNDVLENKNEALDTQVGVLENKNNVLKTQVNVLENKHNDLLDQVDVLENKNKALEDLAAKRVSFHARMQDNVRLTIGGAPIIMASVVHNQGKAYDPTSGAFTAPYNGTYCFLATTETYTMKNQASMYLNVDNDDVAYVYAYYFNTDEAGSVQAVVHLTTGQRVWLKSGYHLLSDDVSWYSSQSSSFSGFLVSADP